LTEEEITELLRDAVKVAKEIGRRELQKKKEAQIKEKK